MVGYLYAMHALGHGLEPQGFLVYLADGDVARPGFWLVVAGIAFAAPLAEEVVFRGFLQGALQRALPRPVAIVAAAMVFGVVHTLPYALPVGLLGILFGWLFARWGGLWLPVAAYALHNLLTVSVAVAWPGSLDYLYPPR
jgi:membrane protease YdiL (CAAX protease family)